MNIEWGDGRNFMIAHRIRARIKVRVERAPDGPWRRCITTAAKEAPMIPDEAVEAAARAVAARTLGLGKWEDMNGSTQRAFFEDARAALEAASPHMMGQSIESAVESLLDAADISRALGVSADYVSGLEDAALHLKKGLAK